MKNDRGSKEDDPMTAQLMQSLTQFDMEDKTHPQMVEEDGSDAFDKTVKKMKALAAYNVIYLTQLEKLKEPFYINPPKKNIFANLLRGHLIAFFFVLLCYSNLTYFILAFFLPYYLISVYSFRRVWKMFGYSDLVLAAILAVSWTLIILCALTLQSLLFPLLFALLKK